MKTLLLKNANVIDGTLGGKLQKGQSVLIEDGVIKKIAKSVKAEGATELDLNGSYVLPGLINLHVHLPASGKPSKSKVSNKKKLVSLLTKNKALHGIGVSMGAKYAKQELLSGVTTLRAVGGVANFDAVLRDKINAGKALGPRILAANTAVGVPNGHMDGTVATGAKDEKEAIALVDKQIDEGADLVKIMITGGILDTEEKGKIGLLKMPAKLVNACCKEAHKRGKKVAAHVESAEGVEVAILNGVDTVEHGGFITDELVEKFKGGDRAYVATFSPAIPLALLKPESLGYTEVATYNSNLLLDGMKDCTAKFLAAGVPVGLGTDTGCPLVTHYDMWRELVYFTKYMKDVDNAFAIHTATLGNAKIAGVDKETGSVEVGKSADLLIVKGNPLEDLTALRNPEYVVFKGNVIKKKNKKYKNVEKTLDEVMEKLK